MISKMAKPPKNGVRMVVILTEVDFKKWTSVRLAFASRYNKNLKVYLIKPEFSTKTKIDLPAEKEFKCMAFKTR